LFGSHAYGTPDADSDLDIYVVVPDNANDLSELYADIRGETRRNRTVPMDLLLGRASVFNHRRNGPTLEKVIAQKGIPIYER
jgi:predicted nucleotidyltransferase